MLVPFFSSSARVWDEIGWISGIEEAGYKGWEIVADGRYRLDDPVTFARVRDAIGSTGLLITVHAPYADLNLATPNYPIWRESIRQVTACIASAAELTDRVTFHPGYLSPSAKLMPDQAWRRQKEAVIEIGRCALDHGIIACLENMIGIREFLCRFPEEISGMTEGIEGIGITIDIGHANTVGKVREFLPILPSARHLHVHDNNGVSDEHLPIGAGNIPWDEVGPAVRRDYSGIVVVEGRSIPEAKQSLEAFGRWFV
jgi:sugar phosphate isomerase/epimerase